MRAWDPPITRGQARIIASRAAEDETSDRFFKRQTQRIEPPHLYAVLPNVVVAASRELLRIRLGNVSEAATIQDRANGLLRTLLSTTPIYAAR